MKKKGDKKKVIAKKPKKMTKRSKKEITTLQLESERDIAMDFATKC